MRYPKHDTRRNLRGLSPFPAQARRASRPAARRGVLLLVILALLAMFGMVAVTFVVVASQARLAAEAHQRLDEVTDPPPKLLNSALVRVLTGSNNRGCAIGPHGLLEDVYGNNRLTGNSGGFSFLLGDRNYPDRHLITTQANVGASHADRTARIGAVLTMIDGPTAGASTRIVGYDPGTTRFALLPFANQTFQGDTVLVNGRAVTGNYIVSGVPFSGTGFGWDGNQMQMTDLALRPGAVRDLAVEQGQCVGANEDYDAVDFRNMLLATVVTNDAGIVTDVIPSLHRPALVNFWDGSIPEEQYILRPTQNRHPAFTGSNDAFHPGWNGIIAGSNYRWDVDNSGDGIPDSIWVDLGFPVRSSADGLLYKPLFAILCIDMDGRLNVNAHGSLAQVNLDPWTNTIYYAPPAPSTGQEFASPPPVLRGRGAGPAEINLGALFTNPLGASEGYRQLLTGGGRLGRYGANQVPGTAGADLLARVCWPNYDYQNGHWGGTADPYGTPPDLQGTIVVGLDRAGRPVWDPEFCGQSGVDSPYEMNPLRRLARGAPGDVPIGSDTPFSATELERILRCFDRDTLTLPSRLFDMLRLNGADPRLRRHVVATDSVDVPVPGGGIDPVTNRPISGFLSLIQARLQAFPNRYQALSDGSGNVDVSAAAFLFGPELATGRKLDLNRPLPPGDLTARQELARHLFCLAMLMRDPEYVGSWPAVDPGVGGNEEALVIRRIAQWAVNVVDFLDNDAVMTPFQYHPNPFEVDLSAWVAGPPANTDNLVWGMERPDVLLSETLAIHDRRVADTEVGGWRSQAKDGPEGQREPEDETLDQPRMPQGSLFVELYYTGEPGAKRTTDLHTQAGGEWRLDLGRTGADGVPVWRLAITRSTRGEGAEANNISQRLNTAPATFVPETEQGTSMLPGGSGSGPDIAIERVVSFANVEPGAVADGPVHYYNRTGTVHLAPGEYLLVGPRPVTYIGATAGGQLSSQYIRLDGANTEVTADALGGESYPSVGAQIKAPKTMIAAAACDFTGRDIGISVSEPLPGDTYYNPIPDGGDTWYDQPYDEPLAQPLDSRPGMPLAAEGLLETNTYQGYRYVLLQRLADPSQPHNPVSNPYRTVDWMPIDLTVFNGEDEKPDPWPPLGDDGEPIFGEEHEWDPDDPNVDEADSRLRFATRERGSADRNLWAQEFATPEQTTPDEGANEFFRHPLAHSLGFLNREFGEPAGGSGAHVGDPQDGPFPWLTWNNRPPVNPYELMMVPATTASRLGWEYTLAPAGGPVRRYRAGAGTVPHDRYGYQPGEVGFVHLMNFFHTRDQTQPPTSPQDVPSGLFHMFDFLGAPSRFAGAHVYLAGQSPPQHLAPTFREPGKINLNTVMSPRVFRGLMNGFREDELMVLWDKFVRSRRGYADSDNPTNYPTEFARPFRSAAADRLWPEGVPRTSPGAPNRPIDATLMRGDPDQPERPLFALNSNLDVNDTNRNPYFRYQGLMRLANLTTTRSNVYAVWITVGFFQATPDANVPGGYRLGRELGTDTGDIRRHRAFYVIDRSIPVGFIRGQDLNAEKTILLQRFIE